MTPEQESLVLDNLDLVHHIIQKNLHQSRFHPDYEDTLSLGVIGLVEAAKKFDPERGYAFSTLAYPYIKHSIIKTWRKKTPPTVPLSGVIGTNKEGVEFLFENILEDFSTPEQFEKIIQKISLDSIDLSSFPQKNLKILSLYCEGKTQREIGKLVDLEQASVCRNYQRTISKLRQMVGVG